METIKDQHLQLPLRSMLSDAAWLVEEENFEVEQLNVFETIFTVGNGYLGTRGSLEEGHDAGLPGTYLNGVFDHYDSFIVDLVNAPDWSKLMVWVEDQQLSMHNCEILDYYRALDLQQGLLYRFTRFKDKHGRVTSYESMRYAHLENRHCFETRITIIPENYSGTVYLDAPIDGNVYNLDLEPAYKEKPEFDPQSRWKKWTRSRHLTPLDSGPINDKGIYLLLETLERPYQMLYGSQLIAETGKIDISNGFQHNTAWQRATLKVEQGGVYHVNKLVSIYSSRDVVKSDLKNAVGKDLKNFAELSSKARITAHVASWRDKWDQCEISIAGDPQANHALKFNIYHLLITANDNDHHANIGAKSLSGEGYKGHVFWDTEIFLLPFYIYTQPKTAKALLLYRYHTMEGAREYARETGFKGVRYPWESADTGHETTPPWTADGKDRIWTGEREIHITSAVVYGVISYYQATGDMEFMLKYGAYILFETARFWDSRLEYNQSMDRYELNQVEGPDEFHELVNNSVYTNWLTQWNLNQSVDLYRKMNTDHKDSLQAIIQTIDLSEEEIQHWREKAAKIFIPYDEEKQLVEQFEDYFKLDDIPITDWDKNHMPLYPEGYHHFNCDTTTLIKQPDVLMLMYMLPDQFSDEIKRINYQYYEPRTMHKSSLSPSIHTIMGVETGNHEKAVQYFQRSALVDLVNNQGNTEWGIHIASAGGTWQAVVNGFAGLRVKNGKLTFKPWLPPHWKKLNFKIKWRGQTIPVEVDRKNITFDCAHLDGEIEVEIGGKEQTLTPGNTVESRYA